MRRLAQRKHAGRARGEWGPVSLCDLFSALNLLGEGARMMNVKLKVHKIL